MDDVISHEEQGGRGAFYLARDGRRIAEMTYQRNDAARITIDHTEVDPSLRGQGIARHLLDAAVAWARQSGIRITPRCSYVVAEFARDKTLADLLA
ncbi:MAG: GNAT family N-acetyltransferase [Pseudomonadota bacterium]